MRKKDVELKMNALKALIGAVAVVLLSAGTVVAGPTYSGTPYNLIVNFDWGSDTRIYTGKGAIVDPGTLWNVGNGYDVSDGTASDGATATTIDADIAGHTNTTNTGTNNLHGDGFYDQALPAVWSVGGLTAGEAYDLFFYSDLNTTWIVTAGTAGNDESTAITSGAEMGASTPDHGDWVEGTHFAVMRIEPTGTIVSGQITTGSGSITQDRHSAGLQVAHVVPEPAGLGLLGMALLALRRKRG